MGPARAWSPRRARLPRCPTSGKTRAAPRAAGASTCPCCCWTYFPYVCTFIQRICVHEKPLLRMQSLRPTSSCTGAQVLQQGGIRGGLGAEPQGGQPRRPAIPHPRPAFQHFPLVLTQGLLVEAWSPGEAALRPMRRGPPFCPIQLPAPYRCPPRGPATPFLHPGSVRRAREPGHQRHAVREPPVQALASRLRVSCFPAPRRWNQLLKQVLLSIIGAIN